MNKYFYAQNLVLSVREILDTLKQRAMIFNEIIVHNKKLEIAQRKIELLQQQKKDFEKFEDDIVDKCKLLIEELKFLNKEEKALDSQTNESLLIKNESYQAQIIKFKKLEKEATVDITGSEDLLSIIPQIVEYLKVSLGFLKGSQKPLDDLLEVYQKSLSDNVLLNSNGVPNYSILLTIGANKALNYIDCIQAFDPNFSLFTLPQDSQLSGQFIELSIQ